MSTKRESLKKDFLKNLELKDAETIKLKSDASHRKYERIISDNNKTFILMDAPPAKEKTVPFITIANFLREKKLSAPEIINSDIENGFLLLEDFGDDSFNNILSGKSFISKELNENKLYENAVDILIYLHKNPSISITLPHYDDALLMKEAGLFLEWYITSLNKENLNKSDKEEYNLIIKHLISESKLFSDVFVFRDYHADNLMWLNDRSDHRKVGILDFQDAVVGSPIYDLVSLFEDARRDVDHSIVENMINRYLKAFPNYSRQDFNLAYSVLAAQRNLKIIGIFARQATKYKNPKYLSLLPRVWKHLVNDLNHPLLLPLKKWLARIVPTQMAIYKN